MIDRFDLSMFYQQGIPRAFLLTFGFILVGLVVKKLVLKKVVQVFKKVTELSQTEGDDFIAENINVPLGRFIFLLAIYFSSQLYKPYLKSDILYKVIENVFLILLIYFVIAIVFVFIDGLSIYINEWAVKTKSPVDDQLSIILKKALKITMVVISMMFLIQNLGYSISGLVASLGLGGLTIAMAAKDAVSNFFGSLIIVFDSPFKVGDWIKAGGIEGVVEELGFRSTKIRTFEKSFVTVPNSIVANTSIENFTVRDRRRIKFTLGIEYKTSVTKVENIVNGIKKLIESNEGILNDFYLVNFNSFGASSLDIFVYCFTNTTVWADYMGIKEAFHLDILRLCEKEGVGIAFPTQSVYIENLTNDENVKNSIKNQGELSESQT